MTEFIVMHSFNELQESCVHCESNEISKLLSRPIKVENKSEAQTGQITKEYIESNKEILEDLKNSSKSESYEPS
tara:strand:+ start:1049 stop:1270 length:222 start_codon:yes stop_codon:yes gene_type:complete